MKHPPSLGPLVPRNRAASEDDKPQDLNNDFEDEDHGGGALQRSDGLSQLVLIVAETHCKWVWDRAVEPAISLQ